MAKEKFDVLIVGAGPAGSFAAERLASAGVRVALFDGRPAGEPKPCGGGVTSKALKAWPHLLEATGRMIDELELYSPGGKRLHLKLEEPFAIYSRTAFDSYLLERARTAGARVFHERVSFRPRANNDHDWIVRARSGAEWSATQIVAADGANSPIAKRLAGPLPPAEMEVAFGYRTPLPEDSHAPTIVAFLPGWAGYAWAFPRVDHISFGIATSQDAFDHQALDALLWRFMLGYYRQRRDATAHLWSSRKKDAELDSQIEAELKRVAERYAARIPKLLPETWNKRETSGKDWVLLGDAAGFADPITGEGIYYAMRSAELFAESYLSGNFEEYEKIWRADFGLDLQRASEIRNRFFGTFFGSPFTERMVEFAQLHRGIRHTLRELVAGEQGYMNLKYVLVKRVFVPI